jgi:secondary thiamine-phosphate synthase enzyme
VTINENADPDVARDILAGLARLVPAQGDYRHAEGNSDAHIKASLVGFSAMVPVIDGRPALGTWQGVYLCEFDGPRRRHVRIGV